MPMALASVVAMPFRLEALPLTVMQWGLAWMVTVAEQTAAWSAGLGGVSALPALALLLMVAGFLWLTLWRERWRLAGIAPLVIALPLAALVVRPDILIDEEATAVAVRGDDGRFSILGGKGADFEVENWLRADADIRPVDAADLSRGVACDAVGCVGHLADGTIVALTDRRDAFADDCRMAGIVVSHFDAPPGCASRALVIDRSALDRFGAHAVYVESAGYRVETAYPEVRRPFMPPPRGN
jgi:competence protein ComEC